MTTQDALSASLQPPHSLTLPGPVWGIDPSTVRLSVGIVVPWDPGEGNRVVAYTHSYSKAGPLERQLAAGLGDLLRFFTRLRDMWGAPAALYLEQPFGGSDKPDKKTGKVLRPHPHSYYFVGLVLCALGHMFAEPEVQMVGPTTWKSKALGEGHGFAKKPEILLWAQSVGYTGMLEDEADAIGVATAGAVILTS